MEILNMAKTVFEIEAKEIENLKNYLTNDFEKAIKEIYKSKGKLIISGMGKSGIIGKKIAATLASTGTPSFFLHPGEAYHGDLGMIEKEDIILLLSNSGETDEVLKLIPFLKEQGNITISMTSNPNSTLAKNTKYHLNIHVEKEACPLQLAPTSSTTATLVMGDALAVVLMKLKNFQDKDFAKFHPGGSLGRRLLTKVKNVMKKKNLPILDKNSPMTDILHKITAGKLGLAIIVDKNNSIIGIITDGDLRRVMEKNKKEFFDLKAKDIMSKNPKTIDINAKLTEANEKMEEYKVSSLIVLEKEKLAGVIQIYDLGI